MSKFVMCLHRHRGVSQKEVQEYWRRSRAPLIQSFVDAHQAMRYVQDHTTDSPANDMLRESRGMMQEFDVIAEVWFDSAQAFIDAMSSPEGEKLGAILHEDESKFIDHARSSAFLAEEHEV